MSEFQCELASCAEKEAGYVSIPEWIIWLLQKDNVYIVKVEVKNNPFGLSLNVLFVGVNPVEISMDLASCVCWVGPDWLPMCVWSHPKGMMYQSDLERGGGD